ncbi:MAG: 3-deoxy-7-phosphoheptulonate synthase [Bacilli bacterium]|jgi:3-deoxy-7-phosphoheptulonate synthase|nr:3-deoxy-7-phosphoheptulonate synthase [Bacilli bacterium]HHU23480.1 3-deoxy-7-phosphoheptulonate synthase [Acholeplasmataceae bacterium]
MYNYQLVYQVKPKKLSEMGFDSQSFVLIAGPCAVENEEDMKLYARFLLEHQIKYMRAGAFKPRTSPHTFQGLGYEALEILKRVKAETGIKIVTEITDYHDFPKYREFVDILQIGARNMQNFPLLKAVGKTDHPVILKRGFGNTVEEWLGAAEHILMEGNPNVILCERGIRTFETSTRNTLDLSSVALLKQLTKLPVIVDPSHATGRNDLIIPLSLASAACGADGIIVEIHTYPERAKSDAIQALTLEDASHLLQKIDTILPAIQKIRK